MAGREETVSDHDILKFVADCDDPFVTTSEVADFLGFSNEGARKRLYSLADDDYLDFKRVGRSPAWWITQNGLDYIDDT